MEECEHEITILIMTNDGQYFNACGSCEWKHKLTDKENQRAADMLNEQNEN